MTSGHFAVIGTGSVAAAVCWMLRSGGLSCYVIGRSGPRAWQFQFEATSVRTPVTMPIPSSLAGTGTVIVCVKAYDLMSAFSHLALFDRPVTVIPFVNGATADLLSIAVRQYPQHLFRTGIATLGVSRLEDGVFALRSRGGLLQFGPHGQPAAQTPSESRLVGIEPPVSDGPRFQWSDDIATLQKRKWLFNTVINSLTAARGLARNGDLLADLPNLVSVFSEAFALAAALLGPWREDRQDLYEKMLRLIHDTRDNENSMAADVRLGRRTESDFLAGLSARDPGRFPLLAALHARISGRLDS